MGARELTKLERELLLWILPEDRSGYRRYRELVLQWNVAGQGRRGEGNYILAPADESIDNESPLPQVLAYGVVVTEAGDLSVTLRERLGNQIEFEIAALAGREIAEVSHEIRRWTFSTWLPRRPCPICGSALREVEMRTARGRTLVLALCGRDHRLWVYDSATGMNHPIPVTNYYNELMLQKGVRDPKQALDPRRLFTDLGLFSDVDLARAFRSYNRVRTKVQTEEEIMVEEIPSQPFFRRLISGFKKTH